MVIAFWIEFKISVLIQSERFTELFLSTNTLKLDIPQELHLTSKSSHTG